MPRSLACAAVAAVLLLSSCRQTYLTYDDAASLRIGAPRQQVLRLLPIAPSHEYQLYSRNYRIDAYPLHVGTIEGQEVSPGARAMTDSDRVGGSIRRNGVYSPLDDVAQYVTEKFFLLYQADTLRYWGMAMDFARSEDPAITDLQQIVHMYMLRYND